VVPEDNHKCPQGGSFEIPRGTGGGGVLTPKILRERLKLNGISQKGGGVQIKKTLHRGEYGYFLEQCNKY